MFTSNPCFEYWLLLHFERYTAALRDYDHVADRLRRHVADYDKTKLRFSDYATRIADAIVRGKVGCPTGNQHEVDPSSGMWMLVERLLPDAC